MLSGSQGEGCVLRILGCRAVFSGSQGAELCSQDLAVRAVLSVSRGTGLCSQDLGVQGCALRISGCRAVLSGSQGEVFLSGSRGAGLVGLGPSGAPVFVSSQAPCFLGVWADGSS